MSNYLDQTGLSYFYSKLKAKFALRSQSLPVIANISRNETTGAMELWSKNLNNIVTTGMYNAITCTNAKFQYSTLIVIGYYLSGYCTQIQQDVTTGRLATRSQINGSWSAWVEIDTSSFYTKTEVDNLIAANAVTASHDGNGTVTISGISTLPDASTQSY
ncbi:pyocin knob domain-containing protein [uncultured Methanobrevibacter sp.]|uniref:pyocin knob domain-containing protein n=1 Tax=uncultured Methanobrevibacter sp. TaxID=253161 RepID=UPI0026227FFE|nr:pyocin knob domain-containing protein [uncultured Methanobrevibacter sp.]